jgi:hypothetical protein
MALVKRDYFGEALMLYEMVGAVREVPTDEAGRWRALWRTAHAGGPEHRAPEAPAEAAPAAGDDPGGPRKKRRRRGGRRRRRPGAGGVVAQIDGAAPEGVTVAPSETDGQDGGDGPAD